MSEQHEQHPIGIYLKVWILLFVLSTFSYMVDILQLQGYLRWSLILIFMALKAGFIISIFMHLGWERFALQTLIILPPGVILVVVALMAVEADYTQQSRTTYFSENEQTATYEH